MVKQNQLSTTDRMLFIAGILSATPVAIFLANGFFRGHTEFLITEAVLYAGIAALYIQAFRASRTKALVQSVRIVSYAAIVTAILILSFVAYFVANFRW